MTLTDIAIKATLDRLLTRLHQPKLKKTCDPYPKTEFAALHDIFMPAMLKCPWSRIGQV